MRKRYGDRVPLSFTSVLTYERGQEFIPKTAKVSQNERKFNWHSNVTWLSFCMYQIFKDEGITLLEHESMENIHKKAANDSDAIVVVNNPDHILRFERCSIFLKDFAFILSRKARESSKSEVSTFEVKVYNLTELTRRKLQIVYKIDGKHKQKNEEKTEFNDLLEKINCLDLNQVKNSGDEDHDITVGENLDQNSKPLTDDQQSVINYLKNNARLRPWVLKNYKNDDITFALFYCVHQKITVCCFTVLSQLCARLFIITHR